jgi:protein SCO1/2
MQIKVFVGFFLEGNPASLSILSMQRILLTACVTLALLGCGRSTSSGEKTDHYNTRGVVRGFSPDGSAIEIQHENVPGFMPSMTMPFVARDRREIADLKAGEAISFRLNVTQKDFWIDSVKRIRRDEVNVAEPKQTSLVSAGRGARVKEGDKMPPLSLTNQSGEQISLDTFRGQPLVLTFVFTRCSVPNFCPRMSNNFEELQAAIKGGTGTLANTRLLSVTLDPAFDTPKVLGDYAGFHHADPKIWSFATGDQEEIDSLTRVFSVYRQTEGGTISHGLATALIDRNGKIERIWRGNAWTPAEVAEAIETGSK